MTKVPTKDVIVVASGGGSGFQKLVEQQEASAAIGLPYCVKALVVTSAGCGAIERAERLDVHSHVWLPRGKRWLADELFELVGGREKVMLSGCIKQIWGFHPGEAINVHPAPIDATNPPGQFAGKGMYGLAPHEAILCARAKLSAVTIHEAINELDAGRVLETFYVRVETNDTAETLQKRVNAVEHEHQWKVMAQWLHGHYN